MEEKNKLSFWKWYGIIMGSLLVLLVAGFFVFYAFMDSYEASQPIHAAGDYAFALSEDEVVSMVKGALPSDITAFEKDAIDDLIELTVSTLKENRSVSKNYRLSTTDNPVFDVVFGDAVVCSVKLGEAEQGTFGMQRWQALEATPVLGDWLPVDFAEGERYTLSIQVPAGSEVRLRGELVDFQDADTVPVFPALAEHLNDMPEYANYRIEGLYLSPKDAISVRYSGEELPITTSFENFDAYASAKFPEISDDSVKDRSMAFTRAYITYTSSGYYNMYKHLADVLSYVVKDTEIYKRIDGSKIAFYYVTPVTSSEYRQLEVTEIREYSPELLWCEVTFDVQENTAGYLRDYLGTMELLFTKFGETWMLLDMEIINK